MEGIGLGPDSGFKHDSSPNPNIKAFSANSRASTLERSLDSMPKGDAFHIDFSPNGAPGGGRPRPSTYHTSPAPVDGLARGTPMPGSSWGHQAQGGHGGLLLTSSLPTPTPMPQPMSTPLPYGGVASPFVRPPYVDLNANRVAPAGPRPHPDPGFRPIGTNNWTDVLYDHTLLQYLSNANIKEIKDHVGALGEAVDAAGGPAPIAGGPFNTDDATAVWKYCDAYMKRRGQERNNRAARRSRARKESETLHWKRLALAAGAEDREFEYDAGDPAYGEAAGAGAGGGGVLLLPRETADAIRTMRARWHAEWAAAAAAGGGGPDQLALPRLPPPAFVPREGSVQQEHAVASPGYVADQQQMADPIHRQVYGRASPAANVYHDPAGQQRSHVPLPARTRAQTRANARRAVTASHVMGQPTGPPVSPTTAALILHLPPISELAAPMGQGQHEGEGEGLDGAMEGWDMLGGSLM